MIVAAAHSHPISSTIILGGAFLVALFASRYVSMRIESPVWSTIIGLVVWFVIALGVTILASATNCALHGGCPY